MSDQAIANSEVNPASQRHWLYGFNVTILVIVGTALVGLVMFLCETGSRGKVAWDVTSSGVNSLSGSTKALIKEIDDSKKDFEIVSLFIDPSATEKANGDQNKQAEKRRQVMDLLNLYARNGSHIRVEDEGDAANDVIQGQIRDRYKDELKPYEDAVADFDPLAKKFKDFANDQVGAIAAAAAQEGMSSDARELAAELQSSFRELPSNLDDVLHRIYRARNQTLPQWGDIVSDMRKQVDDLVAAFGLFADPAKVKASPFAPLASYFEKNNKQYKDMVDAFKAYQDRLSKLQPLKVQDVLSNLARNTVVVLGPDSAKVISDDQIFKPVNANEAADSSPTSYSFNGEELISSALLSMARTDKVKVVFASPSPAHLTDGDGDYSEFAGVLKDNNFDVLEWSPPAAPTPGSPPPDNADPPAQGKGVVWIVFPPDTQNMQMMMMAPPNTDALVAAVKKHMDAGGQVMFLAGPGSANPFAGDAGFPYESILKNFGIVVKNKFTVVHVTEAQSPTDPSATVQAADPYLVLDHYEDTPITAPIQSLGMALAPMQANTVVDVDKPVPAGVDAEVLIKTPYSSDYWAESNFSATPKFDPHDDLSAPVPLAASAVKNKGQKDAQGKSLEQRVIVVGNRNIAFNPVLKAIRPVVNGNQIEAEYVFPGNRDFTLNSILWLSGYENMIAVSSKANAVARIRVSPTSLRAVQWSVVLALPLLSLLLGGMIWFVRHR